MKYSSEEKEDICTLILSELKVLGVKVPKIKKFKPSGYKQEKSTADIKAKIFGVNLSEQEWVSENECTLPKFLADSTSYLEKYTQVEIGLFRKAGSVVRQRKLRENLENGGDLDGSEPNDVASLLKQWLRELPEPVIPYFLHDLFIKCQNLEAEEIRLTAILLCCFLLPPEHLCTLKHLILFLSKIAAYSDVNKMVPHNLAVIMALNLMPSGCDRATCKSGSYLVSCCTSLVELLILNAKKVGEIPQGISSKLSLKLENFDFSIEDLDGSPSKMKKKRRSGNMIDIMTGIRRLVGGSTPLHNFLELPDAARSDGEMNSSRSRCAPKRKAEPDLFPLFDKNKKRVVSDTKSEIPYVTPLLTPIGKTARFVNSLATPITGITPVNRNRRKSFGLLKKKQNKKAKSTSKNNASPKKNCHLDPSLPNSVHSGKSVVENQIPSRSPEILNTLTVPKAFELSPVMMSYTTSPFLRFENPIMKRTYSDCPRSVKKDEKTTFDKFLSASENNLPRKRLSPSPAKCGISNKRKSPIQLNDSEKSPVRRLSNSPLSNMGSKSPKVYTNPKNHKHSLKKKCSTKGSGNMRHNVHKSANSNPVKGDFNSSLKSTQLVHTDRENCVNDSTVLKQINEDNEVVRPSLKSELGIEAVAVKNMPFESQTPMEYETPNNNESESNSPSRKKTLKKHVNKSSLKRGRPNTIKTGLPSELCPKYSTDSLTLKSVYYTPGSMEDLKTSHRKMKLEGTLSDGFSVVEDNVFDDVQVRKSLGHEMNACAEEIEGNVDCCRLSRNSWLNSTPLENDQHDVSISFTTQTVNEIEKDDIFYPCIQRTKSLCGDKNSGNDSVLSESCSTVRRSPRLSKDSSHENIFVENAIQRKSKKFSSSTDVHLLTPSPMVGNINCNIIFDKSEHLSPERSKKENGETWISAEHFLRTHLQPPTPGGKNACKRESIVQLMIRNAGKVQANVQRFNFIANDTTPQSNDEPKLSSDFKTEIFSTPGNVNMSFQFKTPSPYYNQNLGDSENKLLRRKQHSLKLKSDTSLTHSELRVLRSRQSMKLNKSPIPPPPKFSATSTCNQTPYSGSPLKELTNISVSKEDSLTKSMSQTYSPIDNLRKSSASRNSSIKANSLNNSLPNDDIENHKSSPVNNFKKKSAKRRSESSPALNKLSHNKIQPLKNTEFKSPSPQAIIKPLHGHSKSFSSVRSYSVKSRPMIRRSPRRSITNVGDLTNRVHDEWECNF